VKRDTPLQAVKGGGVSRKSATGPAHRTLQDMRDDPELGEPRSKHVLDMMPGQVWATQYCRVRVSKGLIAERKAGRARAVLLYSILTCIECPKRFFLRQVAQKHSGDKPHACKSTLNTGPGYLTRVEQAPAHFEGCSRLSPTLSSTKRYSPTLAVPY
jgi:hypothetical protein